MKLFNLFKKNKTMNFRNFIHELQLLHGVDIDYEIADNKVTITSEGTTISIIDATTNTIIVRPLPNMNSEQLSLLSKFGKQTNIDKVLSSKQFKYYLTVGVIDKRGNEAVVVPGKQAGKYAFKVVLNVDDCGDECDFYNVREIMKIADAANVSIFASNKGI